MKRALIGEGILLLACGIANAQTRDPRVDELTKETAQLKRALADQDRRIADLEKIVRALQGVASPAPARIPADTPPWHLASNWSLIRKGMSESQIEGILGPPTSVQSAIDTRTLLYASDARSTLTLNGSVTLTDDRVTVSAPPNIKALQGTTAAVSPRIPPETPPWQLASNWSLIRKGMPEAQVVEILGLPTSVQSVTDVRTLHYQSDSRATTVFNGSVTLTDDRVTAATPPRV
jgi:outer membrane protein assembly factor BamE (lipoprotein component of BamABCDE complex)